MECEVNAHPLGYEVRLYQRGELQSAQVNADERKREFMAVGWTDRQAMPE